MPACRTIAAIATLIRALLVALAAAPAAAQDWPARPVTMVVPFAAGSGSDVLGRIIGPRLGEHLGTPVIVEDVGGAGGMIGAARVMKAAPDGYQLLLATAGTHAINQTLYKKPLYNAATDFPPVVLVASTPILLITRKDLPADNLPEFIAYAKLHHAAVAAMNAPDVQARLAELGIEVVAPERRSGDYLAGFVVREIEKWAGPIKASGVSMD